MKGSRLRLFSRPEVLCFRDSSPYETYTLIIQLFSACLTSILRTYYTSRIAESPDVSRNVIIMGLWTWAEITTGIVVSCLPVIPKFFQHFGPKFFRALSSFGSKSGTTDSTEVECQRDPADKIQVSVQIDRRLDESQDGSGNADRCIEARCDPNSPRVPSRSEYITLSEGDAVRSDKSRIKERLQVLSPIRASRCNDLETGRYVRSDREDGQI